MHSGVLRLDQIMSVLLAMSKQTSLVFFIAHAEHNLIKHIITDQHKLLTIFCSVLCDI